MQASVGFIELLMAVPFLFGFGGGAPMSLPPLPPDPTVEAAAPDSALYYASWTGVADADAASANQTEQFLAEPEIRELVAYAESAIVNAIRQATGNSPQASAALDQGLVLAKTIYLRPTAIYLASVEPKQGDQPGPQFSVRGGLVINAGDRAQDFERALRALVDMLPPANLDAPPRPGGIEGKAPATKGKSPAGKGKTPAAKGKSAGKRAPAAPAGSNETVIGGVKFNRLALPPDAPEILWGFKDSMLVIAIGGAAEAEALVARMEKPGPAPAWLQKLYDDAPVERRATASYVNVAAILRTVMAAAPNPQMMRASAVFEQLGLSKIESLGAVTGLEGEGMVSRSVLSFDGGVPELFSALVGEPLALDDLRPIPADANVALVARADLAAIYQQALTSASKIHPEAAGIVEQLLAPIEGQFGIKLVDDLLAPLGDVWRIYNSPGQGGSLLTGAAIVIDVRDPERLRQTHARLLDLAAPALDDAGAAIRKFSHAGQDVFYLQATRAEFPVPISWCISDKHLLIAINPQMIKARLAQASDERSLADASSVQAAFAAGGPSALSYFDVESFLPTIYSFLQYGVGYASGELAKNGIEIDLSKFPSYASIGRHARPAVATLRRSESGLVFEHRQTLPIGNGEITSTLPVTIALLLPAVQQARAAAQRVQSSNDLHQIGTAFFNYENIHRSLPIAKGTPGAFDGEGKPLLSWRVHLLPHLEHAELYNEFHLDESWDSPHNQALISRMPAIFAPKNRPDLAAEGKTNILMPAGKGTISPRGDGLKFPEITDGASNTILLVQAAPEAAVIWTKPEDLNVDPNDPFAGLRGVDPGGFQVVFADNSVRRISFGIDPEVLRMLFDPADGKAMPANPFGQ